MIKDKKNNKHLNKIRVISGKWKNKKIEVLTEDQLRPTKENVRETLFNWLQNDIENASTLDLFGGTGALTFEALSRMARYSVIYEVSNEIINKIKETKDNLMPIEEAGNLRIIKNDAFKAINRKNKEAFDIVFIDPPFSEKNIEIILIKLAKNNWIKANSLIYIETDCSSYELTQASYNKFEQIKQKSNKRMQYQLLKYIG